MNPNRSLTILIVDDNRADRETYRRYLLQASDRQFVVLEAESGEEGLKLCRRQKPDAILLDFLLPDLDGLEFLTELKAQANGRTPPVIMLTGEGNERIAVQAMKSGVQDYLVKGETSREDLQQAVLSAWEADYLRRELQKSEERFRTSVENLMDCFGIYSAVRDSEGRIVDFRVEYVNTAACEANQMTRDQQVGKRLCELLPAHRETGLFDEYCQVVETGNPLAKDFCIYADEYNGRVMVRFFDIRISKLGDGFVASWRDVSEQKRTQESLEQQAATLQQQARLLELTSEAILVRNADSAIAYWNRGAEEMYGWTKEEAQGKITQTFLQTQFPQSCEAFDSILLEQGHWEGELTHTRKDGRQIVVESRQVVVRDEQGGLMGFLEVNRDMTERKRAEAERLCASEANLAKAQQIAHIGSWEYDLATQTTFWSEELYRIHGLEPSEPTPTQEQIDRLIHPDDRDRVMGEWSQSVKENLHFYSEYRFQHPDGTIKWVLGQAQPEVNNDGRVIGYIGTVTDISDRKRIEQRLRESEEHLRLGMQVTGFALAKFDYASNSVELSPEAAALYGLPTSELVVPRSRIHATFHPEDRAELARLIEQVLDPAGPGWFARDRRLVWSNGEVRWLTVRKQVFFDRSGQSPRPIYAILAAIDITERKRAEEALRESEERFRTLADNMSQFAWMADESGWIFWYNHRWYEYTGTTLEEMQGWGWQKVHHPEHVERVVDRIRHSFETGELWEDTFPLRGKDGTYRWFLSRAIPIRDSQGCIRRWFGTNTDIDALKQAELQLQQQAQELSQLNASLTQTTSQLAKRNQELDRFAYVVSHDLKAPLRAIANLSQWIEEDLSGQLPEESQHHMELLRKRVRRMESLIDGLLEYSRVGRTEIATETVDVGKLLGDIVDSLAPPPTFTIQVQPQMPTLVAKRLLLSQVFSNLISNAIKHHHRPDGRIEISAAEKGDYYEFTVADDGPGIASQHHEKIFGIFQTLKGRDIKESTGIGLSIVRKIIETEGGEIVLESELGMGATFRFTWLK
jgi:PAS domain S-box-containing protein